jgi:ABC-2 type transport system permease protein
MSIFITLNTIGRVLTQIRHDHRSVGLLLTVPSVLLALLRYVFNDRPDIFDHVGLQLLGIFPLMSMFFVASIAMLRERTQGTLERLLSTPMHKLDLLLGYGTAFGLVAVVQATITTAVAYLLLGLKAQGSVRIVVLIAIFAAILGASTGLLTSAFANTEFQALQFAPAVLVPQILLCGLIWPREEMLPGLRAVGNLLPMTYASGALVQVGTYPHLTATAWRDMVVVLAFAIGLLVTAAATLRRRTN